MNHTVEKTQEFTHIKMLYTLVENRGSRLYQWEDQGNGNKMTFLNSIYRDSPKSTVPRGADGQVAETTGT